MRYEWTIKQIGEYFLAYVSIKEQTNKVKWWQFCSTNEPSWTYCIKNKYYDPHCVYVFHGYSTARNAISEFINEKENPTEKFTQEWSGEIIR